MPSTASRRPGRPPAATADATRDRIVKAARAVFSERGYGGATFQQVAVRADVTRPAVNHYFSSKRALYSEVVARSNELFIATSTLENARRETTLVDQLVAFITFAMRSNVENPGVSAFLITSLIEPQRYPELRGLDEDALRLRREFLTSAVDDAISRGELVSDVNVPELVEALFSVFCGVGLYAGYLRSPDEMDAITDTLRQLLAGTLRIPNPDLSDS
jgi:TetR/AcrR family transcriptional regulator, repressor for uid operon